MIFPVFWSDLFSLANGVVDLGLRDHERRKKQQQKRKEKKTPPPRPPPPPQKKRKKRKLTHRGLYQALEHFQVNCSYGLSSDLTFLIIALICVGMVWFLSVFGTDTTSNIS